MVGSPPTPRTATPPTFQTPSSTTTTLTAGSITSFTFGMKLDNGAFSESAPIPLSTSSDSFTTASDSPEKMATFLPEIFALESPGKSSQGQSISTPSPSPQQSSTSLPSPVTCEPPGRFLPNKEIVAGVSSALVIIAIGIIVIVVVHWARRRQLTGNSKTDVEAAHSVLHRVYSGNDKYTRISSQGINCRCRKRCWNTGHEIDARNRYIRASFHGVSVDHGVNIDEPPLSPYPMDALPNFSATLRSLSPAAYSDSSCINCQETHR